jgi:hypothetical protein
MEDVVLLFSDNTWEFCPIPLINKRCKEHQWRNKDSLDIIKSVLICYCSKNEYRNLSEEEEVYNLHKKFIEKRH